LPRDGAELYKAVIHSEMSGEGEAILHLSVAVLPPEEEPRQVESELTDSQVDNAVDRVMERAREVAGRRSPAPTSTLRTKTDGM
jgi:hypothetical protein